MSVEDDVMASEVSQARYNARFNTLQLRSQTLTCLHSPTTAIDDPNGICFLIENLTLALTAVSSLLSGAKAKTFLNCLVANGCLNIVAFITALFSVLDTNK